eukprot:TRINITY_DN16781_c0_g1_i2.p1 TRINITY_DN16781_c0_g1~~TRINITY_DN16781_c0_g1_i2.p1  ORF type:complete len:113 (+),score=26.53 TRINITY_DN16781_c0_g1_i2:150-488(+)
MITNGLQIFEASPVKAIGLMSQMVDGFKGIRTCTLKITNQHMKELLLRSLLGSERVLTETFPPCETNLEYELGSDAGTDGSFDIMFDDNASQGSKKNNETKNSQRSVKSNKR